MSSYPVILSIAALTTVTALWYGTRPVKRDPSKPPGPPQLPLIGNLFDIPRSRELVTYNEMADKYGEIVHLKVLNTNIFLVSSARILNELYNQRSTNYSDRPYSTMLNNLMDLEWIFAFRSYGTIWRETRKMFHSQFQESVAPDLRPLQVKNAHAVLRQIIANPDDLINQLHLHVAGFLMDIAYAMDMSPQTADLVGMADDVIIAWSKVAVPGSYLVDALPIIRWLPEWILPGGGFRKDARIARQKAETARDVPFNQVLAEMAAGTAKPSFVSNLVNSAGVGADLELIKSCAGTIYFAGTEAIAISLNAFILAMIVWPDVQRKAQAELDAAGVGKDRLPDFTDEESLPYISAIVKEVLRWNPPAPLAIPHVTVKDDHFDGYHIPAKSLVISNLWKITHDPEVFPDPTAFKPERFINPTPEVLATYEVVFGPGRRICPGRHVATAQLFITMASILSVFDIGPPKGKSRASVKPEFTYGLACNPLPFGYTIKPRGPHVQELLNMGEN
ncbi:cytochrome P450 monooxygenase [Mycena rosella]|uniref:Cytochrome P450 monooxygenase n=1 Tax=Mycena rosella TaxID=1033263 RepID=A0AAD7C2Z8_MYCRO|nr:cytochrome P450 monooxygenase [Mycena rosella]KAJ7661013.1 cytochrome P450 monooxygenase [Mycena rosella]